MFSPIDTSLSFPCGSRTYGFGGSGHLRYACGGVAVGTSVGYAASCGYAEGARAVVSG